MSGGPEEQVAFEVRVPRELLDAEVVRIQHAHEQVGRTVDFDQALGLLVRGLEVALGVFLERGALPRSGEAVGFAPLGFEELQQAAARVPLGAPADPRDVAEPALASFLVEHAHAIAAADLPDAVAWGIALAADAMRHRTLPS